VYITPKNNQTTILNGKEYKGRLNLEKTGCNPLINNAIIGMVNNNNTNERLDATIKKPPKAIAVKMKLNPI
jgi:hypothetical protein